VVVYPTTLFDHSTKLRHVIIYQTLLCNSLPDHTVWSPTKVAYRLLIILSQSTQLHYLIT